PHIVKGRMQVVHAEAADLAQRVGDIHHHVAVLAQRRNDVGERLLQPVDLAILQRSRGSGRVSDGDPFDAVYDNILAAREPGSPLLAWYVARGLLEPRPGARYPFVPDEAHRPTADIFADLPEGIGRGNPRRHDEAARGADLAERQRHFPERLFQSPAKGAVIDGSE